MQNLCKSRIFTLSRPKHVSLNSHSTKQNYSLWLFPCSIVYSYVSVEKASGNWIDFIAWYFPNSLPVPPKFASTTYAGERYVIGCSGSHNKKPPRTLPSTTHPPLPGYHERTKRKYRIQSYRGGRRQPRAGRLEIKKGPIVKSSTDPKLEREGSLNLKGFE